jgi:signal transduction histidine kinase
MSAWEHGHVQVALDRSDVLRPAALLGAGALAGTYLWRAPRGEAGTLSVTEALLAVVGVAFVASGVVLWRRRPENRLGVIMVVSGLIWLLGEWLRQSSDPAIWTTGIAISDSFSVAISAMLLAVPTGRVTGRAAWIILGLVVFSTVILEVVWMLFWVPEGGPGNALGLFPDPVIADHLDTVQRAIGIAAALALSVYLVVRWVRASAPMRRAMWPVLVGAAALPIASSLSVLFKLGIPIEPIVWALLITYTGIPIAVMAVIVRQRMARSAVAELVVELGQTPTPARLRDALANALGDPTLRVLQWSPGRAAFLDADGEVADLPAEGSGQAMTRLERDGHPTAAIVHDAALLDDPGLVASVASAMRLATENERLQAEVEAQLDEVRASRMRIVEAGDAERRRVERDLHDGAQQRIVSMTLALRLARAKLGDDADPAIRATLEQASEDARAALTELRELARGIHPQILTEAGLPDAIESLAGRSRLDVDVEVRLDGRLPPALESAAYFVVSEALANVAKYAGSDRARVASGWAAGQLTVEVSDDGGGGADPAAGSGLKGLADRVAAVDGTLEVISPAGRGTRIVARLPAPAPVRDATMEAEPVHGSSADVAAVPGQP